RERPAVAVFRSVRQLHGDAGQRLDQRAADESRVPRRAAGYDRDAADLRARLGSEVEPVEARGSLGEQQAPPQRAAHRLGLLADLLQHEVRVAAQLDRIEVTLDVV